MCSNYCTARKCEWLISVSLIVGFPFETLTQLTAALCNVASLGHFRGNCAAPLFLGTCGVTVTQLIFSWETRCTSGILRPEIPNVTKFCPFFSAFFEIVQNRIGIAHVHNPKCWTLSTGAPHCAMSTCWPGARMAI